MGGEEGGALGDVDGQVANAFEVAVDLEDGDDETEVGGDGLIEGEDLEAVFFDLDFHLVELDIVVNDAAGELLVAAFEGAGGVADGLLGQGAEGEDFLLELLDFSEQMGGHIAISPKDGASASPGYPKRPVT